MVDSPMKIVLLALGPLHPLISNRSSSIIPPTSSQDHHHPPPRAHVVADFACQRIYTLPPSSSQFSLIEAEPTNHHVQYYTSCKLIALDLEGIRQSTSSYWSPVLGTAKDVVKSGKELRRNFVFLCFNISQGRKFKWWFLCVFHSLNPLPPPFFCPGPHWPCGGPQSDN